MNAVIQSHVHTTRHNNGTRSNLRLSYKKKSTRAGARSIFSGGKPIESVSAHKQFPQAVEGTARLVAECCYFVFFLRCLLTQFDKRASSPDITYSFLHTSPWIGLSDMLEFARRITHIFPLFFCSYRSRPLHLAHSAEHTAHTILSHSVCDSFYRRGNMRTLNDILRFNPVVVFKASRRTHVSAT